MDLKDYFARTPGTGVLSAAAAGGTVDAAVSSTPQVMDDGTVAFIMRERLTHENLKANPHAAYLFPWQWPQRGSGEALARSRTRSRLRNGDFVTDRLPLPCYAGNVQRAARRYAVECFNVGRRPPYSRTGKGGSMKKLMGVLTAVMFLATAAGVVAGELALPKDKDTYKHVGSLIIPDKTSPLFGIHHFTMNKKALGAFEKGAAYPEGSVIVGSVYEVVTTPEGIINEGKKQFYTYMQKNKSAAETGGWIFAAFAPDGKKVEKDVKKDCFACHTAVKDADYVFSKPLK
jgi:hypothetical protein